MQLPSPKELQSLISYDPDTGILRWKADRVGRGRPYKAGDVVGATTVKGYRVAHLACGKVFAHRIAWAIHHGSWPAKFIDHLNRDKSDNRICNLREVSFRENLQNRGSTANSGKSSGLPRGVYRTANKGKPYKAVIIFDGNRVYLGCFATVEDAEAAYCAARSLLHHGYVPEPTSTDAPTA